MPRVALDLDKAADRAKVKGVWRSALGYVPGEANQGLVAETEGSPARMPDYDDSGWQICDNLRLFISRGFTFGWWRIAVELPETLDGMPIAGANVCLRDEHRRLRRGLGRRPNRHDERHRGGLEPPAARRDQRQRRAGRASRHRLPGRQRAVGQAGRRDFHPLRHPGLRDTGVALLSPLPLGALS